MAHAPAALGLLAMSMLRQEQQQRQRAVSPPGAIAIKREMEDDEVQIVGARQLPRHPGAPPASHGAKRERSNDEDSLSQRRVARRISSEDKEEEPERNLSMAKLVMCLIRSDDDSILEQAVPNLLMALHEQNHEKRLEKQEDFYQVGGHLAVVSVVSFASAAVVKCNDASLCFHDA